MTGNSMQSWDTHNKWTRSQTFFVDPGMSIWSEVADLSSDVLSAFWKRSLVFDSLLVLVGFCQELEWRDVTWSTFFIAHRALHSERRGRIATAPQYFLSRPRPVQCSRAYKVRRLRETSITKFLFSTIKKKKFFFERLSTISLRMRIF